MRNWRAKLDFQRIPAISMISHTAYFDTFAKRKILGLAPEKYVVLADRANIGNAAYVECWRAHCDIIGDQYALLCTAGLCFCDLEVQCFRSFPPVMTHIDRHAKLLKSESSSDVVPRTYTSAGAGSRSALRSGKIAPIARTDYRRHVAAGRQ